MSLTPSEIGLMVGGILTSLKIIEFLIRWIYNATREKKSVLVDTEREQLKSLYDWHNKSDIDGNKIWYVPRSWSVTQEEILQTCMLINNSQKEMMKSLDKINDTQDKMKDELIRLKNDGRNN